VAHVRAARIDPYLKNLGCERAFFSSSSVGSSVDELDNLYSFTIILLSWTSQLELSVCHLDMISSHATADATCVCVQDVELSHEPLGAKCLRDSIVSRNCTVQYWRAKDHVMQSASSAIAIA